MLSKDEAINTVFSMLCKWDTEDPEDLKNMLLLAFQEMPSAQPEREKGKWIYGEDEYGIDGYRCDKCGFFVLWDYGHNFINYIGNYNFCPSCGADMRGEEDDT